MDGSPIPRILHQTWKTESVPEEWAACVASVREQNPGWEYHLWTDAANRAFVAEHYPALLPTFDAYPYEIQRADAVRYCLLHHFGGVYVDLDIECLQPLDTLIEGGECLIVLEPSEQGGWLGLKRLASNAFMAARPGHGFLEAAISALAADRSPTLTHRDVLETTGPAFLARVLDDYVSDDVTLLPSEVMFPFVVGSPELSKLWTSEAPELREALRAQGTYGVHYWANTWVHALAGRLINPEPYNVPGYEFFRGLDSPGNDFANVGRDVKRAATACDAIPNAVAFNTDGFVKTRLLPRELWIPMRDPDGNAGLYVKKALLRRGFLSAPGRLFRRIRSRGSV